MDVQDLSKQVESVLSPDLLQKKYREANKKNPMFGHCYAASEALFHLLGGVDSSWRPMRAKDEAGIVHWWLVNEDDARLDVTAAQYTSLGKSPPYDSGVRGAFLTGYAKPSKRAVAIIDRVKAAAAPKEKGLRVAYCSHQAARYACEMWHYSRCLPMPPLVPFGAWEDGEFIGVVIFGRGASPQLGKRFGLRSTEICELVRVSLRRHRSPVTKIMAICLRLLRKQSPGLRLVVSFADPGQGHVGGIYQAGNWIYTGSTSPSPLFWFKGRWQHMRVVSGVQFGQANTGPPIASLRKKIVPGKYRYTMPLDDEMRERLKSFAEPYPKKEKSDGVA